MVRVINAKRKKELAVEIVNKMFYSLGGKHFLITNLINSRCDWTHLNESAVLDIPKVFAQCFWLEDDYLVNKKQKDEQILTLQNHLNAEKSVSKILMEKIKELEEKLYGTDKNKTQEELDLDYLIERDKILTKLEIGGVDNWEWYSESLAAEDN